MTIRDSYSWLKTCSTPLPSYQQCLHITKFMTLWQSLTFCENSYHISLWSQLMRVRRRNLHKLMRWRVWEQWQLQRYCRLQKWLTPLFRRNLKRKIPILFQWKLRMRQNKWLIKVKLKARRKERKQKNWKLTIQMFQNLRLKMFKNSNNNRNFKIKKFNPILA